MLAPCIDLKPVSPKGPSETLDSRLFGRPCLQHVGDWPRSPDGRPLGFVGQINLGVLSARCGALPPLPDHGLLSLFYNFDSMPDGSRLEDRYDFRLLWAPGLEGLKEIAPPRDLSDIGARVWLLGASRMRRLPSEVDAEFLLGKLSESEFLDFDRLSASLGPSSEHRLLGPADWLDGDARESIDRITLSLWPRPPSLPQGAGWRLLWQVGGDPHLSNVAGDEVRLFVLIRDEDLLERRFLRAWVVLQRGC